MANVWLGPEGSETLLPVLRFMGSSPSLSVTTKKQTEKARMSDGSFRWAFFEIKRRFPVVLGYLSSAQLTIVKNLNALKQILRYKDLNEEDVWYYVVITEFTHEPERTDARNLGRYKCIMTLEEA